MFPCSHEPEDQPERPGEAASSPGPTEPSRGRPGQWRPRPAADAAAAAADGEGAAAPEAAGAAPPGEAPGERPPRSPGSAVPDPAGACPQGASQVLLLNPRDPKLRRSHSAFPVPALSSPRGGQGRDLLPGSAVVLRDSGPPLSEPGAPGGELSPGTGMQPYQSSVCCHFPRGCSDRKTVRF